MTFLLKPETSWGRMSPRGVVPLPDPAHETLFKR
jgi:hypothetical protein